MIKKYSAIRVTAIAFFLSGAGLLFAGGQPEGVQYKLWCKDSGSDKYSKEYILSATLRQGITEVAVGWKSQQDYRYAILFTKASGVSADKAYTNPTRDGVALDFGEQFFALLAVEDGAMPLESNCLQVVRAEAASISVDLSGFSTDQIALLSKGPSNVKAKLSHYREDFEYLLVALKSDGAGEMLKVKVSPEFFPGERELFGRDEYKDIPYEKKALAFLGTLWKGTGEHRQFKNLIRDTFNSAPTSDEEWGIFERLAESDPAALGSCQASFRSAFSQHFQYQEEMLSRGGQAVSLPFIEFGENSFDAIYGATRNVYVSAYLLFLFNANSQKGKPLLAYEYQRALNRAGFPYNYKQYAMISENEGKKISHMALRYLSWGVEYTPFSFASAIDNKDTGITTSKVFARNRASIEEWVTLGGGNRESNYYSGQIRNAEAPAGTDPGLAQLLGKLVVQTPFSDSEGASLMGNPLPYAAKGIDGPRTFAYKMWEQWRAREWYKSLTSASLVAQERFGMEDTTLGQDRAGAGDARGGYLTEMEAFRAANLSYGLQIGNQIYLSYPGEHPKAEAEVKRAGQAKAILSVGETIKPFLAGRVLNTLQQMISADNSPYNPDKIAGVDSLGMLTGILSMADIEGIQGALGTEKADALDEYFAMADGRAAGLDSSGKPAYYVWPEEGYLKGDYRLSNSDIERATVLVPDLSLIQEGDLIVKYQAKGEPHIGVFVGWVGDGRPAYGEDAREWWSKVMVVSVKRGFRMVNLGTWGESFGVRNTFTVEGKMYQIRRLVKLAGAASDPLPYETWDLARKVQVKERTGYPSAMNVPRTFSTAGTIADLKAGNVNIGGYDTPRRFFYRELPPTSLSPRTKTSIFLNRQMRVTELTGWRDYQGSIRYHLGVDFIPAGLAALDHEIRAPEAGLFYIFQSDGWNSLTPIRVAAGTKGGSRIDTDNYKENTHGLIGVLITNPDNPLLGRVYLFCHLGPVSPGEKLSAQPLELFKADYIDSDMHLYPAGIQNAVIVKEGDWIANVGLRGLGTGAHVHMEVWEYFQDDLATNENSRWGRVDPLSCFDKEMYSICSRVGAEQKNSNTYGWWARIRGNLTTMGTEAQKAHATTGGVMARDAWIDTWTVFQGTPSMNWLSMTHFSEFTSEEYERVFLESKWEIERQQR